MQRSRTSIILMLALTIALAPAAQLLAGTRKAFDEALAQLKRDPEDLGLRKTVISLSRDLKSLPDVPEEVAVLKGKAAYIAKSATSQEDYRGAVDAYKQATLLAPWDANLYYNQGVMEEKAGLPADATRDFKLYLLAKPDADDREKVLQRLGKLEVQQDKVQKTEQAVVQQQHRAVLSAAEQKKRDSQSTAAGIVTALGVVALCGGAVELGLGYGATSDALYTTSPGYSSSGVLYNKYYEGKYWSATSYKEITDGEAQIGTGWLVLGVGTVVTIIGVVMFPGPVQQEGMLNVDGSKLAWGLPRMDLNQRLDGVHTTLLHAQF